jgi:hypothetical protein
LEEASGIRGRAAVVLGIICHEVPYTSFAPLDSDPSTDGRENLLIQCIWTNAQQGQVVQLRDEEGTLHWIEVAGNYRAVQESHAKLEALKEQLEQVLGPAQEQEGYCQVWSTPEYVVIATLLICPQSENALLSMVRLVGSDSRAAVSCLTTAIPVGRITSCRKKSATGS